MFFWKVLLSPQRIAGALIRVTIGFLVTSPTEALLPRLLSLAGGSKLLKCYDWIPHHVNTQISCLGRVIVHVDMDTFYAAVEMRDCPELKDKLMAVGSMSMLSTSNYHSIRFGKLCPNLFIVLTNFDKYRAVSAQIFSEYDPHFMPMSLDEACHDCPTEQRKHWPETMQTYYKSTAESEKDELSPVLFEDSPSSSPSLSGAHRKAEVFGTSAEEAVREMRFRIQQKTSLTASAGERLDSFSLIGIAPNMMLAKVCSDKNKPNGQYRIPPERQAVMEFIRCWLLWVIVNCDQLGPQMALLSLLFSGTSWHNFLHISLGLGSTCIERCALFLMLRTFGVMSDPEEQYSLCRDLCHDLAQDLLWEGLKGKTVTLKLKNVKFEGKTRAFTVQYAVYTEGEIFAAAKDLLKVEIDSVSPQPLKLRLMVSGFISTEDKKPLQRSIMGFLQKGGSDSGSFTQCVGSALKAEEDSDGASFLKLLYINKAAVLKPSFKIATQVLQCLACPVCNTEMKNVNLTVFNRHIDECLKGSAMDNEATGLDAVEEHISGPVEETDDGSDFKTPFFRTKINGKRSVIHKKKMPLSESSSKASQTTNSLEAVTEISSASKGLSLMCPVCSQPQSTDDLALFNRHVDMCLNQEVLLEFRESHAPVDHSDSALKGVRGQCRNEKMQGSSPLPPSKEIKVLSTKHTIDKFFKDNTRQNI
uniref:DNA polymerase kappa n=1 Tax=Sinocyclocheilus grahami TaxID=75366 RepID=A0A672KL36_SINGR